MFAGPLPSPSLLKRLEGAWEKTTELLEALDALRPTLGTSWRRADRALVRRAIEAADQGDGPLEAMLRLRERVEGDDRRALDVRLQRLKKSKAKLDRAVDRVLLVSAAESSGGLLRKLERLEALMPPVAVREGEWVLDTFEASLWRVFPNRWLWWVTFDGPLSMTTLREQRGSVWLTNLALRYEDDARAFELPWHALVVERPDDERPELRLHFGSAGTFELRTEEPEKAWALFDLLTAGVRADAPPVQVVHGATRRGTFENVDYGSLVLWREGLVFLARGEMRQWEEASTAVTGQPWRGMRDVKTTAEVFGIAAQSRGDRLLAFHVDVDRGVPLEKLGLYPQPDGSLELRDESIEVPGAVYVVPKSDADEALATLTGR